MALRNYLYAKHDTNPLLASRISGQPLEEKPEYYQTITNLNEMSLNLNSYDSSRTTKDGGKKICKNCPDCPKNTHNTDKHSIARTAIEMDQQSDNKKSEIDYTKVEF